MTLSTLLNRSCTILQRVSSDVRTGYGDLETADVTIETVCELQQRTRAEPGTEGEVSDSTWLLILPAGTVIATEDAVVVDGETFELVGEPWRARNPRTHTASHVEATVRRASGGESES